MNAMGLLFLVAISLCACICMNKLQASHFRRLGKKRRLLQDWHSTFPVLSFSAVEWVKLVSIVVAWVMLASIAVFFDGGSTGELLMRVAPR